MQLAQPSTNPAKLNNLDKVEPRQLDEQFVNEKECLQVEILENTPMKALQGKDIPSSALLFVLR